MDLLVPTETVIKTYETAEVAHAVKHTSSNIMNYV